MIKEETYDERIAPMMSQIIQICKDAKINMAATFALDVNEDGNTLFCTTVVDPDESDEQGYQRVQECRAVMYPKGQRPRSPLMVTTVDKDGKKTITAIL